ncbi:MAG: hypothetical protein NTY39_02810 [Campylobacterales bacterium]|nr:hypothetical protein [Campylobacterales bacterium]
MKKNRPEAVMLSVEEYEHIKELADIAEYISLAELIRERKTTPKESYIPFEDVMAKSGITLDLAEVFIRFQNKEKLLASAKKIASSAK